MTGLEREVAEMRRQIEINNALVEALTVASAVQQESVERLVRALEAPAGDDAVMTILRRLDASSRRIAETLESLVGPTPAC